MESMFLRISNGGICDKILDQNDYFIVECYSLYNLKELTKALKSNEI